MCQNGLETFVLEISHWMMLHGQSGRPVEVDSDQMETLIETNQCYTMWELAYIFKISKSIVICEMKNMSYFREKNLQTF